jgi:hypothetical protein
MIEKAMKLYLSGEEILNQPSLSLSTEEEHDGKKYVVLRNVNGLIAVYEVKDKRLKRVINYPEAF